MPIYQVLIFQEWLHVWISVYVFLMLPLYFILYICMNKLAGVLLFVQNRHPAILSSFFRLKSHADSKLLFFIWFTYFMVNLSLLSSVLVKSKIFLYSYLNYHILNIKWKDYLLDNFVYSSTAVLLFKILSDVKAHYQHFLFWL